MGHRTSAESHGKGFGNAKTRLKPLKTSWQTAEALKLREFSEFQAVGCKILAHPFPDASVIGGFPPF